jgi:hypothetical protein
MATASKLLDLIISKCEPSEISLKSAKPPQVDKLSYANFLKACEWIVLPQGFHAPMIFKQAELQAWTLKPANPKFDKR